MLVVTGITLPNFAGSLKGAKLKAAARTVSRMARYARSMAILRDETYALAIHAETLEAFLGSTAPAAADPEADGELDQEVLKRLGYVKDDGGAPESAGISREIRRRLPEGLSIRVFEKEWTEADEAFGPFHVVRFYPNGQCEWFLLELEDGRGLAVRLENDPVSGKIRSEFTQ